MSKKKNKTQQAPVATIPQYDIVNKVEICGNVVKVAQAKGATIVTIATKNNASGVTNYVSAFAFENHDEIAEICKVGERVTVFGELQTSKKHPESAIIIQSVILEAKNRLDAEFRETTYRSDENKVLLRGEIVGTIYRPTPNIVIITVCTTTASGYVVYPHVMFFGNIADSVAKDKKPGDTISILGSFQPHKFMRENTTRYESRAVAFAYR